MPPRTPIWIELSDAERRELEHVARAHCAAHREVVRASIILLLADGRSVSSVARKVGRERRIVRKWAERFQRKRLLGLEDDPRSGRPARFSPRGGSASGEACLRAA
jgi:transposase-like protein